MKTNHFVCYDRCLLMTSFSARYQVELLQDTARSERVISLLEKTITDQECGQDHEIIRCAIALLANFAKFDSQLVGSRLSLAKIVLSWLDRTNSREVRRQCALVLACLSSFQNGLFSNANAGGGTGTILFSRFTANDARDKVLKGILQTCCQ